LVDNRNSSVSLDAVKRLGFVFVSQILLFTQTLFFIPAVINVAGEEIFGAYSIVLSYLGVAYIVSSFGLTQYCRRWLPQAKTNYEKAKIFLPQLWFQLIAVLSLGLIASVCYQKFITNAFQLPELKLWVIPSYLVCYTLFSQVAEYFRDTHRTKIFAISIAVYPYLFMAFCVLGYLFGEEPTLYILVLYQTYAALLVGIVLFTMVAREIGYKLSLPSISQLRVAIPFGLPVLGATFAEAISVASDKFIIAGILTVRDVGIYVPAYTLGIIILLIPRVLSSVLLPILSRVDKEEASSQPLVKQAAQFYCIVAMPYIVIMALVGHDLLRLYTNQVIADASSPALFFVACSALLTGLNNIRSSIFFVRLDTIYMLKLNVIVSVSTTIFTAILLIIFKEVWICGLALFFSSIIGYKLTSRRLSMDPLNFQWEYKWLIKLLCSVLIMTIVVLITQKNFIQEISILSIVTQSFPGLAIYAAIILLWMWIEKSPLFDLITKFNQTKE
jgi:O-antigen/teichoic acid export membrane protein